MSVYSSVGSISGVDSYTNSPMMSSFGAPRLSPSASPQIPTSEVGGIRLPNAPLNDIASFQSVSPQSPRKAATTPYLNANGRPISPASANGADYMSIRKNSLPAETSLHSSPMINNTIGLPEVTGWQPIPMTDLDSKAARSRSSSRKPVAV